ncbi:uncharacterized protein LOC130277374 isoform X1 [Hyla sarda]|uniref:uncharacterized protein LOC130277374 isoform X1 n=1 Tax=Hyla sarda TaxID=327740 RepID=UPI0024C4464F|nr:uncharacterized protein LOC130277374 isoform X1 [Hyla sarda]
MLLASIDIENLYTSIPQDKGVECIREILSHSGKSEKVTQFICESLTFILKNNAFLFDEVWYRQIGGVAMGTPVACTFANLYVASFEEKYVFTTSNPFLKFVRCYHRFVDDVFIAWDGTATNFREFVEFLNEKNEMNLRFTYKVDSKKMEFLDVLIETEGGELRTSGYRKPTAFNSLLQFSSYHPQHTKTALPYGQFLRLRRINDTDEKFISQAEELKQRLVARGYPVSIINTALKRALAQDRNNLLATNKNKKAKQDTKVKSSDNPVSRFSFSFKFSPLEKVIRRAVHNSWSLIKSDTDLGKLVHDRPLITFKRCKNLRDAVTSSNFCSNPKTTDWLTKSGPTGNHKCGTCIWCPNMKIGKSTQIGGEIIHVNTLITCRTQWVVYAMICSCGRFYIGSTKRTLNTRFREHVYSVKTKKGAPCFIEHMNSEHKGICDNLLFQGLEVVRSKENSDKRKLLLQTEAKWIIKLNAAGNLGLNERVDYSVFL